MQYLIDIYTVLRRATENNYSKKWQILWDRSDDDCKLKLIKHKRYMQFRWDARFGRIEHLRMICEFAKGYESILEKMLKSENCYAFRHAAENNHLKCCQLLLNYSEPYPEIKERYLEIASQNLELIKNLGLRSGESNHSKIRLGFEKFAIK